MVEPSYSLPEGTPGQQPRRQARKPLFLRIADSGPDTAVIMDISVGGALLRASRPLAVGDPITITLPRGAATEARVTWSSGALAGCQFLTPITEAMVSAALLKSEPTPADDLVVAPGNAFDQDAPDARRMAYGIPVIVGASLILWAGIAVGIVAIL
ncbi:hypothetical protein BH11PSE5_BH11PSE5_05680 [soil metagenome]|uniref:PilZ domain-containing protein n=1 Tax=unclassified Sphingobium TaxID=2611147 RepID=UPI001E4FE0E4|nr:MULTISPECIES: PilZ domain-containing protein [unclassified Sphingobium]GLI98269.1 hypothetical protein Sbs19_20870 [Sphingobium sp. BS19]CAH0350476.1 hypothetical protein SPH9361_01167 [Sphingobium sp. CECT 9361]